VSRDRAAVPELRTEILTSQAFVEFGEVLDCPDKTARFFYNQCLENRRPEAKPDLSIALIPPVQQFPLTLRVMERHPYSSQTFIPMRVQRYLVIVAPDHPGGGPDMTGARAYIAAPDQGITFRNATAARNDAAGWRRYPGLTRGAGVT